jgi:hypothetical protein
MGILMKKQDFINTLRSSSLWAEDRFNNFKLITSTGKVVRLKIQAMSVRLETQVAISGQKEWFNISSDYFKNITMEEKDLIRLMKIGRKTFQV